MMHCSRSYPLRLSTLLLSSGVALVSLVSGYPPTPIATALQAPQSFSRYTSPPSFPVPFSLLHPTSWVAKSSGENYIILTNYELPTSRQGVAPDRAIKTDITLLPEPFEAIVRRSQTNQQGDDSRVIRRGRFQLAGRDGLRLWTTDSSFDFPDAIISYLRYSDTQTILIISFYTAKNTQAPAIIQQVHGSFRVTPDQ